MASGGSAAGPEVGNKHEIRIAKSETAFNDQKPHAFNLELFVSDSSPWGVFEL